VRVNIECVPVRVNIECVPVHVCVPVLCACTCSVLTSKYPVFLSNPW